MTKIAVVVLADTETHGDLGRAVNALELALEAKENDDDLKIVFDGAGTKWIPELANKNHRANPLYEKVKDKITGACEYCAGAFGVKENIKDLGVTLLDEYKKHPSIRSYIKEDYSVVTF